MRQYNNGEWTYARFQSFIKSALRSASKRWPQKYKCLNAACVGQSVNAKTGRLAKHYKCAGCNQLFVAKDIQVDHIQPIINPTKGFTSWDDVINNMFCEADNLQCLCIACHKNKTNAEKAIAKGCRNK